MATELFLVMWTCGLYDLVINPPSIVSNINVSILSNLAIYSCDQILGDGLSVRKAFNFSPDHEIQDEIQL